MVFILLELARQDKQPVYSIDFFDDASYGSFPTANEIANAHAMAAVEQTARPRRGQKASPAQSYAADSPKASE